MLRLITPVPAILIPVPILTPPTVAAVAVFRVNVGALQAKALPLHPRYVPAVFGTVMYDVVSLAD